VAREAYFGIASHASADLCWEDKIAPMVVENQFPELTGSPHYDNPDSPIGYPALDDRDNWNCLDCAYHMDSGLDKPEGIRRVMRHYGLDPEDLVDQARVIFWDDEPDNIYAVLADLPCTTAVLVPRHGRSGSAGGCGITAAAIDEGWAGW
jgi:hypothetical protein